MSPTIPTLDFSAFTISTDQAERKAFTNALVESLSKYGFVKLMNHGINEDVLREMFERTKQFFSLPQSAKAAVAHPPSTDPQRGWSAVGVETTWGLNEGPQSAKAKPGTAEKRTDAKEHYDVGPPDDHDFPMRWPCDSAAPGFRAFVELYFALCQRVALQLMAALEVGLGLPPCTFTGRCDRVTASELRLNHYPPIAVKALTNGSTRRIWPHTDFGLITLLFQDAEGGLEVEDRASPHRDFIPVLRGHPNEMIVNTSATLQRWTNDVLRAGLHQVSVPHDLRGHDSDHVVLPERYSVAFLFKAERGAPVGAIQMPPFVDQDRPAKYDDITALEFQKLRTRDLYADKKDVNKGTDLWPNSGLMM